MPFTVPSRRRLLVVVATLAGACALSLAACQAPATPAALDRHVYGSSLPTFLRWRQSQHHLRPWDLSTDGCSASPDRGPTFDFRGPCTRHDFAWRNLRRLEARGHGDVDRPETRRRASLRFGEDLRWSCRQRPSWHQASCRALAVVYERAVLSVS